MRTDPRAAEVRAIVERVFASFLEKNEHSTRPALRVTDGMPKRSGTAKRRAVHARVGSSAAWEADAPSYGTFPRLYQPEIDGGNESAVAAETDDSRLCAGKRGGRHTYFDLESSAPSQHEKLAQMLEIDEKILIERGRCVARSYRVAGWFAMWLVAVGIVQFYDDAGRMLGTVNLFETLRPKRKTA
jgi:hypothetical protein